MNRSRDVDSALAHGRREYADVLAALDGWDRGAAIFTQTGGMCAALQMRLETGYLVLVTEADDPLAWSRADHASWGVGVYAGPEGAGEALIFDVTGDPSLEGLLRLMRRVLGSPALEPGPA
jgi:hypothetical protein